MVVTALKTRRKRRGKVNKAAEIRESLSILGADTAPKDVIAALRKKGIKVSSAQVSNIKAALSRSSGAAVGRKKAVGRPRLQPPTDVLSVADLIVAKKFVQEVGTMAKAQECLAALTQLL